MTKPKAEPMDPLIEGYLSFSRRTWCVPAWVWSRFAICWGIA
jgi:hypothetical protein